MTAEAGAASPERCAVPGCGRDPETHDREVYIAPLGHDFTPPERLDAIIAAARAALAAASPEPERCASCNGTLWVDDENWEPGHPRAKRKPHDGLIPCGACNEGGWDAPWPSPAAPTVEACVFNMRAEGVPLPDCGLPPGHQNHQPPKQHFGQHPFRSSATVEALRDALLSEYADDQHAADLLLDRLIELEAAVRADERTRLP